MSRKVCALVIGHKKSSPGAMNGSSGLTEFDFNEDLASRIKHKTMSVEIRVVYRTTYKELPNKINQLNPDFIISLHCNAYNKASSGTEVLYYHTSQKGRQMAQVLQNHLVTFLGLKDRGVKPKSAEDRGGYLLRYTNAPCVIAEPFFIDNDQDLSVAMLDKSALADCYVRAIHEIANIV